MHSPNRNDPCPCGSGKKYKKCCMNKPAGQGLAVQAGKPPGHESKAVTVLPAPELLLQAVALHQAGRLEQARTIYQDLLRRNPADSHALHYLGLISLQQENFADAVRLIESAIRSDPRVPAFYCNLGNAYKGLRQFDNAASALVEATRLDPDFQVAYCNLGNIYLEQGKLEQAVSSYRSALALQPDFTEAHYGLGNTLQQQNFLGEAVASYRKAIELKPNYAEAYNNLGHALKGQGNLEEAAASYQAALSLRPDDSNAYSNLLYMHAFSRDITIEAERRLADNWENIALDEAERNAARNRALTFANPPRAGRMLRIGVVSAELGQHPVAEFLEPLLEQWDRSRIHVSLYSAAIRLEPRAERFVELADEYRSVVGLADDQAAELIRSDRIDVLIDTTGHMNGCRLGIFARRAAPVQCEYIGYHGTTGLTEMDWFIADEVLLPASLDAHFREKIWRLPRLRLAYRGDASLPASNWKPDANGTVWLGSFNNLSKIREQALGLWGRVMNAVPESRLLLKNSKSVDPFVQQRIRDELARYGIDGERIEFAGWISGWNEHMALYDRLDIALDAIPLNSETTAFDALWMGVPLVALEGNWYGARMASTILKALGKTEWVARDEDEYVAIVAALARDVDERKALRASQRSLVASSPLCDAKGLARSLEDAFEAMFDLWAERAK